MATHIPQDEEAVRAIVSAAGQASQRLEIGGGGTRAHFGAPDRDADILSVGALRGIVDYDPAELVLTVRAGTSLAEVMDVVTARGQCLAFEPYGDAGSTIGGTIAAATAGSRRLSAGAVRDHLLGFRAVSGRGEIFVGGAKVVKNVTGYDLPKLMCGSWGRLAVLTEVTLKVLPRPVVRQTLAWRGLDPAAAWALMSAAMRLPADVAAAAHMPDDAVTLLRIEGFGPSVAARAALLRTALAGYGAPVELDGDTIWASVRGGAAVAGDDPLWRLSVSAGRGLAMVQDLAALGGRWLADWAGGLVWLSLDGHADQIRDAAVQAGGHATLMRAPAAVRALVPALHPPLSGVAALNRRVRRAFDPVGMFESGRFLDDHDAD